MKITNRISNPAVALESTLLVHGVPKESASTLSAELCSIVRDEGSNPALIGVVDGSPTIGMDDRELSVLLAESTVAKANTANLGICLHRGVHAATTVSTTMELAAAAGVRVFATGGIGGVHRGYGSHLDISADLIAFTRHPVAVVTAGVKSILDVESTREMLETLGIPVIGYQTSTFPSFYLRDSGASVDARFDDPETLAQYIKAEMDRTGRGIVIANPIPEEHELPRDRWNEWFTRASDEANASGAVGRDWTPAVLSRLHAFSEGATLRANIELVKHNARVASRIAAAMGP